MRGKPTWRLSAGTALLVAVGFAWGCAEEVGDIDRTQPDKIEKELFQTDDEWYLQQTVIDTGMEGGNIGDGSMDPPEDGAMPMAFPALESPLKRIRWTVTEDVLYAHSSVELADGLNEGFDEEDARREGVVAAFPIQSHFDVQRQYNAATGEPTNVIVEDRSDRPWYDREYMRVDWATNLVDGFRMFQGQFGQLAPADYERPQEDDRIDPNRTRITEEYIDTVNEYFYQPDIYACEGAYGMDAVFGCEGGRLSVRTGIQRVPDEQTYKPLNYTDVHEITRSGDKEDETLLTTSIFDEVDGEFSSIDVECTDEVKEWMLQDSGRHYEERCRKEVYDYHQRFGYFRTERMKWDRYAGDADDNRRYYINRWNIWQTMLDDEGNRKDEADRIPKPITYHLNLEYPEFMFDAAQETAAEWNDTFRETVRLAMDISESQLDSMLEDEYGHTEMFRIVENSCHPGPLVDWYGSHGNEQDADRINVDEIFDEYVGTTSAGDAMEAALWDLSHEARENMCAELEYATYERDGQEERFSWERFGDLRYSFFNWIEEYVPWAGYGPSSADPKTGEIIRGNANFAGGYIREQARYAADLIQYFNDELEHDEIVHGAQIREDLFERDYEEEEFGLEPEGRREMAMRAGADPDEFDGGQLSEGVELEELDELFHSFGPDRIQEEADRVATASAEQMAQDERMIEVLSKPRVKNMLLSDVETQKLAEATAHNRYGPNYDDEQFHQVYLDIHTPKITQERHRERKKKLSMRSIHTHEDLTNSLENLVTYKGVAEYFEGADRADIIEYFLNGMFIGTQLHEIGHTVGLRHNFSGHADALNYHEEFWEIERAVQTGEITRDEAYSLQGDMLDEVVDSDRVDDYDYLSQAETKLSSIMDYTADMTGRFTGLGRYDRSAIKFGYGEMVEMWDDDIELPNTLSLELWLTDYRRLPEVLADDVSGPRDEVYEVGIDRILNGREYVPLNVAKSEMRDRIKANTENWENMELSSEQPPMIDRSVEYEFCSDEFAGRMLDCGTWLYGGNQTEMVSHAFDSYRALQPFWRYRRHNIDRMYDNLESYQRRLIRTMQVSQEPFRYYSIYRWFNLGTYTDDLEIASIKGFNFFNELLGMPEPGRYCMYDEDETNIDQHWYYDLENVYVPARFHDDDGECANAVDVPLGDGFLYNYGFSPEYEYRIDRVGTYIDKMMASVMLFEMSADFAESGFFTDQRATNLSYWTFFKDEMIDMLGGIITGDYQRFGSVVNDTEVKAQKLVDPDTFGTGEPTGDEGLPRILTPQSLNHEMNALLGGLIYGAGWEDREIDFTHYVKVATTDDEWQPMDSEVDVVEFVHPISGQIYQAPDIQDRGIGAELIERANELGDRFVAIDNQYRNAEPGSAQYESLREIRDRRRQQMQDLVAKMDLVRDAIDMTNSLR